MKNVETNDFKAVKDFRTGRQINRFINGLKI